MMPESLTLKIKRLHPRAVLPTKAHPDDAGWDLTCVEEFTLWPGRVLRVPVGLALELPRGYYAQVRDRSSLAAKGVIVTGGVIDSSYRGAVDVVLVYLGSDCFTLPVGSRIAQFTLHRVPTVELIEVAGLGESGRGEGGFGSSGA